MRIICFILFRCNAFCFGMVIVTIFQHHTTTSVLSAWIFTCSLLISCHPKHVKRHRVVFDETHWLRQMPKTQQAIMVSFTKHLEFDICHSWHQYSMSQTQKRKDNLATLFLLFCFQCEMSSLIQSIRKITYFNKYELPS